jgi:hypothetical protein
VGVERIELGCIAWRCDISECRIDVAIFIHFFSFGEMTVYL